jgi:hypothetical protein
MSFSFAAEQRQMMAWLLPGLFGAAPDDFIRKRPQISALAAALLTVPASAALQVAFRYLRINYLKSSFYHRL